jgi:hypothetical protein
LKSLAVAGVSREPVSPKIPCLTGKIQGIFSFLGPKIAKKNLDSTAIKGFQEYLSKFGTGNNSDLPPSNRSMLNERIFGTLSV